MFIPCNREKYLSPDFDVFSPKAGGKKINSPEWTRGVKSPTPITLNALKFHTGPETLSKGILCPTKLAESPKIPPAVLSITGFA